ncbi:unnamed protein product [Arabidopsis thaliana]|uniref:Uncharacterized protein n=1 Tax=Arabidopsis thaliana TaxID=3702 RepID=A0A654FGQ7_ARATH|nr:unnamed protein product [Arabidopsis thaliana]
MGVTFVAWKRQTPKNSEDLRNPTINRKLYNRLTDMMWRAYCLQLGRREEAAPSFITPDHNYQHIKLDYARFDGGDPTEWLSKLQQYITFH